MTTFISYVLSDFIEHVVCWLWYALAGLICSALALVFVHKRKLALERGYKAKGNWKIYRFFDGLLTLLVLVFLFVALLALLLMINVLYL